MLEQAGFVDVQVGPGWDTFGGARGEANARAYEVYGYPFLARTPWRGRPPLEVLVLDDDHRVPIWISAWAMVPPGPGNRIRSIAPNTSA
jgi:hypothetical protein